MAELHSHSTRNNSEDRDPEDVTIIVQRSYAPTTEVDTPADCDALGLRPPGPYGRFSAHLDVSSTANSSPNEFENVGAGVGSSVGTGIGIEVGPTVGAGVGVKVGAKDANIKTLRLLYEADDPAKYTYGHSLSSLESKFPTPQKPDGALDEPPSIEPKPAPHAPSSLLKPDEFYSEFRDRPKSRGKINPSAC